ILPETADLLPFLPPPPSCLSRYLSPFSLAPSWEFAVAIFRYLSQNRGYDSSGPSSLNERMVAKVTTAFSGPDTETCRTRTGWPRTPSGGVSGPLLLPRSYSKGNHKMQPSHISHNAEVPLSPFVGLLSFLAKGAK